MLVVPELEEVKAFCQAPHLDLGDLQYSVTHMAAQAVDLHIQTAACMRRTTGSMLQLSSYSVAL